MEEVETIEWHIRNARRFMNLSAPDHQVVKYTPLIYLKWLIYFYPHGKNTTDKQERSTSGVELKLYDEKMEGKYHFSFALKNHICSTAAVANSTPRQFFKDTTHGLYEFVPRDQLLKIAEQEDEFIITITIKAEAKDQ